MGVVEDNMRENINTNIERQGVCCITGILCRINACIVNRSL